MAVCLSFLILLVIHTVLGLAAAAEPVHLPIIRRSSPPASFNSGYYARAAERLRARYAPKVNDLSVSKRGGAVSNSAEIPLVNQALDTEYLASINIGTPPQNLTVLLDTASADLWVVSNQCGTCSSSTPEFDYANSTTFQFANGTQQPFVALTYPAGSVQGSIAQDLVSMGGLSISSQTFVVTNQTISGFMGTNVSGIIGLAFSPVSKTNSVPFWQNLFNSNQLGEPLMSFYLTRYVNVTGAHQYEYGGEFTLGGTNTSLYTGDIEYQNLANNPPDYWSLQLSGLNLGGKAISVTTPALTVFDIGAKYIAGPSPDVKTFWQAVPNSQALTGGLAGYYSFPCATNVQAAFSFGGSSWAVDPADMNLGSLGSGQCLGAIHELDTQVGSASWVMGETFMKNVYSVFRANPPSLGFAHLSVVNAPLPTSTPSHPHSSIPTGPIIGGVVGGIVTFALIITAVFIFLNRRKRAAAIAIISSPKRRGGAAEKLTATESRSYSLPGSDSQSIFELTPFVPPGPLPHPRDSWSQRSSQPTFTASWVAPTGPGQMTPDTLIADKAADDYGPASPFGPAFASSSDAATNMPLLPQPVATSPVPGGLDSGECSPTSSPCYAPKHWASGGGSFGQQDMQSMVEGLSPDRSQLESPPMPTDNVDYNIYVDYDRLMGEPSTEGTTIVADASVIGGSDASAPPIPEKDASSRRYE